MTPMSMIADFPAGPALGAIAGFAAGVLLGLVHFGSLWWNTQAYLKGGVLRALAIQLARFALLVGVLAGLAKLGALPLLGGALGLMLGRAVLVRRFGRPA